MHLLLSLLAAIAPALAVTAGPPNPTVTIASGVVVGTATRVTNQPTVTELVNAYLGVPFASSPPLRFAPPAPAAPWQTLQAQTLPPACLQEFFSGDIGARTRAYFNNPLGPPPPESEDCLYLNVFAPQSANATNTKPVLFWIYGGNLSFGTASLAYFNGSSLAVNEDVVVVAINYRTNIFGFSNSPEIAVNEQNSGFLDQRFALQWVQENIRNFGGDPTRVTIFGESAGGFSVKQLLAQPPSPLPFRAAIIESQGALVIGDPAVNYATVVNHFNCTTATSQIACLRNIAGTDIQSYIIEQDLFFGPVKDETNMNADTLPSIQSGQFARVPILIGTNSNEFRAFSALFGLDPTPSPNLVEVVLNILGLNETALAAPLEALYNNISALPVEAVDRIFTDLIFTCPTQTFSNAVVSAGRQPVWRYYYEGDFPNLRLFPYAGAYHSAEIPSVFGTYALLNALGAATGTQIALSANMQQVWANFAKNPSAGPGWPQLGSTQGVRELGTFGSQANPSGEDTKPLLYADESCAVIDALNIAASMAW